MGPDGKAGGVLISLDDVTELEQNKAELAQARDDAEAANRAKSDFLANMSHEIRTPMNAILGFTEVLKRGWGKNEREARKHLDTIHSSGKHLIELINDILDLSKVEAGRMEVERIDCEPHKVIREVVKVFNARAREKGVTLAFEAATPLPERIQSDPGRMRQIVTNLVGNALKFTERGGVRVVARMAGTRSAPQLAIDVVDTGVGIPEDKIGKLFQAFVQADTSVTRKFGGTGLGLVLSRNFARALGGDITVTSVAGQGSTFTATVDTGALIGVRMLDPAEATRVDEEVAADSSLRWEFPARRILVVDDGPENRELVCARAAGGGAHRRGGGERPDRGRHGHLSPLRRGPHGHVHAGDGRLHRHQAAPQPRREAADHRPHRARDEGIRTGDPRRGLHRLRDEADRHRHPARDAGGEAGRRQPREGGPGARRPSAPSPAPAPLTRVHPDAGARGADRPRPGRRRGWTADRLPLRQPPPPAERRGAVRRPPGRAARRDGAGPRGRELRRAHGPRPLAEGRGRHRRLRRLHGAGAQPRDPVEGGRRPGTKTALAELRGLEARLVVPDNADVQAA